MASRAGYACLLALTCVVQAGQVGCLGSTPVLGIGDISDSTPRPPMLPGCQ